MLELRNINKGFGEKQILSNFSLKIPEKQILAIVGPLVEVRQLSYVCLRVLKPLIQGKSFIMENL